MTINITLEDDDDLTIRTKEGHHLFVTFQDGHLSVHNENAYDKDGLATVTKDGWELSQG